MIETMQLVSYNLICCAGRLRLIEQASSCRNHLSVGSWSVHMRACSSPAPPPPALNESDPGFPGSSQPSSSVFWIGLSSATTHSKTTIKRCRRQRHQGVSRVEGIFRCGHKCSRPCCCASWRVIQSRPPRLKKPQSQLPVVGKISLVPPWCLVPVPVQEWWIPHPPITYASRKQQSP